MAARRLGRPPEVMEFASKGPIKASSVAIAVRGQEETDKIIRDRLSILGRHYRVDAVEVCPDTICEACSRWGHGEHNCASPRLRCTLCATTHRTDEHACPVFQCEAPKGTVCVHTIAKCPNCRGPHEARSVYCPKGAKDIEKAKTWKGRASTVQPLHPPPRHRNSGRRSPRPDPGGPHSAQPPHPGGRRLRGEQARGAHPSLHSDLNISRTRCSGRRGFPTQKCCFGVFSCFSGGLGVWVKEIVLRHEGES